LHYPLASIVACLRGAESEKSMSDDNYDEEEELNQYFWRWGEPDWKLLKSFQLRANPIGNCVVCGKKWRVYACHQCRKPVCHPYHSVSSECGLWIPNREGCNFHDDNNYDFWCNICYQAALKAEREQAQLEQWAAGREMEEAFDSNKDNWEYCNICEEEMPPSHDHFF
jgi:hypothetical protein